MPVLFKADKINIVVDNTVCCVIYICVCDCVRERETVCVYDIIMCVCVKHKNVCV